MKIERASVIITNSHTSSRSDALASGICGRTFSTSSSDSTISATSTQPSAACLTVIVSAPKPNTMNSTIRNMKPTAGATARNATWIAAATAICHQPYRKRLRGLPNGAALSQASSATCSALASR